MQREWHYGKCSRPELNSQPYRGVNSVSVDGGHGYLLSRRAAEAVTSYAFSPANADEMLRGRFVNIYEDQLVAHILVSRGFLPTDYSGFSPYLGVPGVTPESARDICTLLRGHAGAVVGRRFPRLHHSQCHLRSSLLSRPRARPSIHHSSVPLSSPVCFTPNRKNKK